VKEFDLIPEDYKERIWRLKIAKIFLFVLLCSLVSIMSTYGVIAYANQDIKKKIDKLNLIKEVNQQQQEEFNQLQQIKNEIDGKWGLLKGLRSTPPPEEVLSSIDTALRNLDVWFSNLQYVRTEHDSGEGKLFEEGHVYTVRINEDDSLLSIGSKLIITGGAANHSTLSLFVANLLTEKSILDAKVLETSTKHGKANNNINYTIEIIIKQEDKAA